MRTARLRQRLYACNESIVTKAVFNACLIFALFGGSLWQVLDVPDDPGNLILDSLMIAVLCGFCAEICLSFIVDKTYPWSFFFFTDVLGTASMVFEISWLLGPAGKPFNKNASLDPTLMRAARVAKMAARAGRFLKLAKFLEVILAWRGVKREHSDELAAVLSQKLTLSVSTKVSLLTITLVVVVPVFSIGEYPAEDLSMKAWTRRLEGEYARAYRYLEQNPSVDTSRYFEEAMGEFVHFYSEVDYFPFQVTGYPEDVELDGRQAFIPGEDMLAAEPTPVRKQNIVILVASKCEVERSSCNSGAKAEFRFNFDKAKRVEAAAEMGMCVFIILVMCFITSNISQTIDRLVVVKLERMLNKTKLVAMTVLQLSNEDEDEDQDGAEVDHRTKDEFAMLEKAFLRIGLITKLTLSKADVGEIEIGAMIMEEQGVAIDLMCMKVSTFEGSPSRSGSLRSMTSGLSKKNFSSSNTRILMESWPNFLTISGDEREKGWMFTLFGSRLAEDVPWSFLSQRTARRCYRAILLLYADVAYHNAAHAVDVTHSVYRLLCMAEAPRWIKEEDILALLVAALGHDAGHQGRTNQFLIETRHALAMTYNDTSPLENMHAATLFRTLREKDGVNNIFGGMTADGAKQARKTCISAILHTDNAHHFEMVRDLRTMHELNEGRCKAQGVNLEKHHEFVEEVLVKNSAKLTQLVLHTADISNAMKPFHVCLAWADCALREFFDQGDEEKLLGLPVGMLNDREKVNVPASQHGFVTILVEPLLRSAINVFAGWWPLMTELVDNLDEWNTKWLEETDPAVEQMSQREEEMRKLHLAADELIEDAKSRVLEDERGQKQCLFEIVQEDGDLDELEDDPLEPVEVAVVVDAVAVAVEDPACNDQEAASEPAAPPEESSPEPPVYCLEYDEAAGLLQSKDATSMSSPRSGCPPITVEGLRSSPPGVSVKVSM